MRISVCFDAPLNFRHGFRVVQIDVAQFERPLHEVNVAVGEARQQQPLPGVDHPGRWPAQRFDLGALADGDNLLSPNSDGLGPFLLRVHCVDAGVYHDHIGRLRANLRDIARSGDRQN